MSRSRICDPLGNQELSTIIAGLPSVVFPTSPATMAQRLDLSCRDAPARPGQDHTLQFAALLAD